MPEFAIRLGRFMEPRLSRDRTILFDPQEAASIMVDRLGHSPK
jgi:hypothetical protein